MVSHIGVGTSALINLSDIARVGRFVPLGVRWPWVALVDCCRFGAITVTVECLNRHIYPQQVRHLTLGCYMLGAFVG